MSNVIYSVILSHVVVTSQGHRGLGSCECKARKLVCFSHDHDISPKYHSRGRMKLETLDNLEDNCPNVILVKLLKLKNHQVQRFLSHNLTEVIFLEISYSKTFKLSEGMFNNTQNLKELTLTENKIHSLLENIFTDDVQQLKMLNLNGNKLKTLNRNIFGHLGNLKELHLRENKIVQIENLTFVHLRQLSLLNLANNRIRHVTTMTFRGLTQLQTLILSRNQIISFQPHILKDFISLRSLYLTGNPLKIFPKSTNQLKVIPNNHREGEMHKVSDYTEWPILVLGFSILQSFFMVSSVFIIRLVRKNQKERQDTNLRLYILHANDDSPEFVSKCISQLSQEIRGDPLILTRDDAMPGRSVIQEAIRMVTESDVLIIIISRHQDSLMDLVISRSGQNQM